MDVGHSDREEIARLRAERARLSEENAVLRRIVPDRLKLAGTYVLRFRALCEELSTVEVELHHAKPPKRARRELLYERRNDIWRRLAELEALARTEQSD